MFIVSCNANLPRSKQTELERGPMPNVMAALPNIGGTLCECSAILFLVPRLKVWMMPDTGGLCSNAANIGERKTWT